MTAFEQTPASAGAEAQVHETPLFPVPESVVQEAMDAAKAPGLALGILHEGAEYVAGFGVTNVENPLPVDADTLCQIGSITKTFTATAVMRLVEQGKLDLDRPIQAYLPDFHLADEDAAAAVTVRHLFTHSGGWLDLIGGSAGEDPALTQFVARLGQVSQLFAPGSNWSYSNSGLIVAGRVIEAVTDKPYDEAIKELVLDPLGMDRTFFRAAEVITYRFAVGHQPGPSGTQVIRQWELGPFARPAGGVVTSVRQFLRYARFHLGDGTTEDGTRLLSAETMQAMRTPQMASNPFGLSWHLDGDIVWHAGGTFGQSALLQLVPDRGFAFLGMTNVGGMGAEGPSAFEPVSDWAFKELLGVETREPAPIPRRAEDLLAYVGTYEDVQFLFEVRADGDRLTLERKPKPHLPGQSAQSGQRVTAGDQSGQRVRMGGAGQAKALSVVFIGDNEVMVDEGPQHGTGEFLVEDGNVRWLRWSNSKISSGRLARRVD